MLSALASIRYAKVSLRRERHHIGSDYIKLSRYESCFYKDFGIQFSYGHREILLNVMRESFACGFMAVLQHGAYTPSATIEYRVRQTPRRGILSRHRFVSYSRHDESNIRRLGHRDVISIGAPWLYLNAPNTETKKNHLGFFPTHHNLNTFTKNSSVEEIRNRISSVRNHFPGMKLTVFLYFSEYLMREWHDASQMYDFSLFCAGLPIGVPSFAPHPSRINFLPTLRDKLNEMELCVFESFSSAILYAGSLKKDVTFVQTPQSTIRAAEDPLETNLLMDIFGGKMIPGSVGGNSWYDKCLDFLGADQIKNEEQLKSILQPVRLPSLEKTYLDYVGDAQS